MGVRKVIRLLAVGLYLAVTRLALLVAFVFTCLFFVLNSRPLPGMLSDLLRSVLPGTLTFGTIQASPLPWRLDVVDVNIYRPDGERVVRAASVRVNMDILPLLDFVAGRSANELHLHFRRVRLQDFDARIVFDDDMHFEFLDAFTGFKPSKEPDPSGRPRLRVRLTFDDIEARDGTCFLRFPEWEMKVRDIRAEARLFLVNNRIRIESKFVDAGSGEAWIRAAPDVSMIPRRLEVNGIRVDDFLLDHDRLSFGQARLDVTGLEIEAQDGALDWASNLAYEGRAFLFLPDGSPVMRTISADRVHGAVQIRAQGRGDANDPRFTIEAASPNLTAGGQVLGNAWMSMSGGRDLTGRWALSGVNAELTVGEGYLRIADGSFHPFGDGADSSLAALARIELSRLPPERVLEVLGVTPPGPPVPIPTALDGSFQARLSLSQGQSPTGFAEIVGAISGPLPPRTILAGRDVSLHLDARLALAGDWLKPQIKLRDLEVRSGPDVLHLRGAIDLAEDRLSISGGLDKDLGSLLTALGVPGEGMLSLSQLVATGPVRDPSVKAVLLGRKIQVANWPIDAIDAKVGYALGEVSARDMRAQAPFAELTIELISLGVVDPKTFQPRPAMRLSLTGAQASRVVLQDLPLWRDFPVQGEGSLSASQLSLDLSAPLQTLAGDASATFGSLAVADRVLNGVRVQARMGGGELRIDRAAFELDGGGAIEASGILVPGRDTFEARVTGSSLSLAALAGTGADGPLQGQLDLEATGSGRLADPVLSVSVVGSDLRYDRVHAKRIVVEAERLAGGDLTLHAPEFLPKMRLNPQSGLTWRDGAFRDLVVMIDINRLNVQDLLPSLRVRDLWGRMVGNIQFRAPLADLSAFELKVVAPPDGLVMGMFNREVVLVNQDRLQIDILPDGAMQVTGLTLWDGQEHLQICGQLMDANGQAHLMIRGALGAYALRAIKETVSLADGYVYLTGPGAGSERLPGGCTSDMSEGDGAMTVTGPLLTAPVLAGTLRMGAIEVGLRRVADTIRIQPGGRILLGAEPSGRQTVTIDPEHWIRGAFGDGTVAIFGNVVLHGLVPDSGEIGLTGAGLRIVSPGEFYVVVNPSLRARFRDMAGTRASNVVISGQIAATEGSYHKNFDVVHRAFSGFTGRRVAARSGRSLVDALPWLAGARLDVGLTGSRFGVRSKILVGTTDLELSMNLQVRGTVSKPELWNRLEIQPGGKMTYDVVRREFEIVRGTLDFTGPMDEPIVELTARTRVEYTGSGGDAMVSTSRFSPDDSGGLFDDNTILVTLVVSGRYPNLDIELASNSKSLTQTDLQYLLLTGSTMQEGGGGMAGTFNLGMLTEDVTGLVTNVLLGSFVDAINFGINPSGSVNVDVMAHMGSRLKFDTRVLQGQGASRYSAGFLVRLTERLSLQGRVRGVQESMDPDEIGQTYETKLRYRIPLE